MRYNDNKCFTRLIIYGPRDRSLTPEEAKALVAERINAFAKLSGEKFVTGRSYGIGNPSLHNMYYAYFERPSDKWPLIHVSEAWGKSAREIFDDDEHCICD